MSKLLEKFFLSFLFFFVFQVFPVFCDEVDSKFSVTGEIKSANQGFSDEEFRRGVQAFYRGSYNEAIMQFEKALSYTPENNLILDWMGKAYYYSGMESVALQEWNKASENGYGGLLLQNKIEIVRERRVSVENNYGKDKFTEATTLNGVFEGNIIFNSPVSVLPDNDGSFWVLAYGSNELLKMNINGSVINRITGPVNGFDHPLDLVRLHDGSMLITETLGDRLAVLNKKGKFVKYIGEKGRGVGQMLGPQYACQDGRKNIYVSDYGNRRVDVFDKNGEPLFYFGLPSKDFEGLKGPTGIAVVDDTVYVVDDVYGCIYEFDLSGNYRSVLIEKKTLNKPESLKVWNDFLVVSDQNKVFSIDLKKGVLFEIANTGNAPSKITCAVPDVNGLVLMTDMKANEIYVMAKMHELVGGLFVQIERVNADNFPTITFDVKVENRHRQPVVGIKEQNFYITEDRRPVSDLKYLGSASNLDYSDITIVVDRSSFTQKAGDYNFVDEAVKTVAENMVKLNGKGVLRIVSAGNIPVTEYSGSPSGALNFSSKGLKTTVADEVPMDLALRLATNELINSSNKRAIVIVSAGKVSLSSFEKYSLSETVSYMNNNAVSCACILSDENTYDDELKFIIENTKGSEYFIYREEGIDSIVEDLIDIPLGIYTFSYTSVLPTNFGEKFLPIEVETYLLNGSGRDETGYFSPLQ